MMLDWYKIGQQGEIPEIPAPGYSWKTTPALNKKIFEEYKSAKCQDILEKLNKTHQELLKIINSHSDKELFTKKLYKWTGTTSLGAYFISSTSSHYAWAGDLIKKWKEKTRLNPKFF